MSHTPSQSFIIFQTIYQGLYVESLWVARVYVVAHRLLVSAPFPLGLIDLNDQNDKERYTKAQVILNHEKILYK